MPSWGRGRSVRSRTRRAQCKFTISLCGSDFGGYVSRGWRGTVAKVRLSHHRVAGDLQGVSRLPDVLSHTSAEVHCLWIRYERSGLC